MPGQTMGLSGWSFALLVGCSSPDERPPSIDATGCPSGADAVYGFPFESPDECIDFGAREGWEVIACLPQPYVASGVVSCYERVDGSQRVMTAMAYPDLDARGWSRCAEAVRARTNCP